MRCCLPDSTSSLINLTSAMPHTVKSHAELFSWSRLVIKSPKKSKKQESDVIERFRFTFFLLWVISLLKSNVVAALASFTSAWLLTVSIRPESVFISLSPSSLFALAKHWVLRSSFFFNTI